MRQVLPRLIAVQLLVSRSEEVLVPWHSELLRGCWEYCVRYRIFTLFKRDTDKPRALRGRWADTWLKAIVWGGGEGLWVFGPCQGYGRRFVGFVGLSFGRWVGNVLCNLGSRTRTSEGKFGSAWKRSKSASIPAVMWCVLEHCGKQGPASKVSV